jgi:enoyl-CoA hydratase/carnithine racemase
MSTSSAAVASEQPYVLCSIASAVATLTLNRGDRFNPLSMEMIAALRAEIDAIAANPAVRVVVLAANGRGFCAGHDLKEMRGRAGEDSGDKDWQKQLFESCNQLMVAITRMPQPVIARVQGIATAAGCQLVSMCDLAVASDAAKFALPGVNVGVFCSTPAVGVGRNIGRKRAMEMLLTGDAIDAETALDWGLVNRVVPLERLDEEVAALADAIAARSAKVVSLGKRTFYEQMEQNLAGAYGVAGETMACNLMLADAAEGIDAFLQKRPAAWNKS